MSGKDLTAFGDDWHIQGRHRTSPGIAVRLNADDRAAQYVLPDVPDLPRSSGSNAAADGPSPLR